MLRVLLTASFVFLTAQPLVADDLGGLSPQELQQGAVEAVDNGNAQSLLEIMREMQLRQLLFFEAPADEACDREPERVGLLASKPFAWGAARQAYSTYLRQQRLEKGDCGCLTSQMTFDEFATELFGATAASMSEEQYQAMLAFKLENESATSRAYRGHVAQNCVGE